MIKDKLETFKDICERHKIWIIKYYSNNSKSALFLIWHTEILENEMDKLLTYKDGKIFTCRTLNDLQDKLKREKSKLNFSTNFNTWINDLDKYELIENHFYELNNTINSIEKNRINSFTMESISNFVNLFNDFAEQDKRNHYLKKYSENELLLKIWEYYYDNVFWKKNGGKENDAINPILKIDNLELSTKIKELIKIFEINFNVK